MVPYSRLALAPVSLSPVFWGDKTIFMICYADFFRKFLTRSTYGVALLWRRPLLSVIAFNYYGAVLPARRYASAGLCDSNVSVRLSGTLRYCVKTKKASVMISSPSGCPTILVFWCHISSQNSKGVTPSGGVKQGRGR